MNWRKKFDRYSKEADIGREGDVRRKTVDKSLGFELINMLDLIWIKDHRIVFLLTAVIESEKWELLRSIFSVIAEGGYLIK